MTEIALKFHFSTMTEVAKTIIWFKNHKHIAKIITIKSQGIMKRAGGMILCKASQKPVKKTQKEIH